MTSHPSRGAALIAAAAALAQVPVGVPAAAQGWNLDVGAGSTAHASVPGARGSVGATLGVRYEGARWLVLSAGVPFDSAGLPWAAAGAGARVSTPGRLGLGLDVAGHGHAYRDPLSGHAGGAVTATAMPLLGIGVRAARLEIRSGLVHYSSVFAGQSASRTLHHSDARLSVGTAAFRIGGEGRYLRAPEGDYPYLGGDAELAAGPASVFAYAGQWMSDSIRTPAWGAGGRLRVRTGTALFAVFQQETRDPVYWNAPRTSWSVGITQRLGSPARSLPSLAPDVRVGGTTFRLPASASLRAPAVAGDFTGWRTVPMSREGAFWTVTLPVPSGVHRYAFRRPEGEWFVPEGLPGRTDDGFGGVTAILVVGQGAP